MSAIRNPERMTVEDYLAWEARQPEKWELVDGRPIERFRARGMAGGTRDHARIAANIIGELRNRLPGNGPCAAFTSDLKLRTPAGAHRYPDVTVDCGVASGRDTIASAPRAVFEVLSPSNAWFQQVRLLEDYQSCPTLEHIVFFAPDRPVAHHWRRGPDRSWVREEVEGIEVTLDLAEVGAALSFGEVYRGVAFEAEVPV